MRKVANRKKRCLSQLFLFFLFKNLDIIIIKMSRHERFAFKFSAEILEKAEELGVEFPFRDSINYLFENVAIGLRKIPNRMAVQPMEGFDAELDSSNEPGMNQTIDDGINFQKQEKKA